MPIVLITFAVGIAVGYWICRMQLRGKFLLFEEQVQATAPELPPSWCPPQEAPLASLPPTLELPIPLSQQWNLPPRGILPTPLCPEGFSAKQVIGYTNGDEIPPQYHGGLPAWKETHPVKRR